MSLRPFVVTPKDYDRTLNIVGEQLTVLASGARTGGYEVFLQRGPEGSGPPAHNHPWDESFYVTKGEIEFGIDKEHMVATAGTLVHLPAGTTHWFRFGKGGGCVDQRGIPVEGDFVHPVVSLFVLPAAAIGQTSAHEITGPGRLAATIMRVLRRIRAEPRHVGTAVKISPEKVVEGALSGGAEGRVGLQSVGEVEKECLARDVAVAAPVPAGRADPERAAVSIIL